MQDYHVPIMLTEIINALRVKKGRLYLDGTLGGGGHTEAMLKAGGRVIAVDKDEAAIDYSIKRLEKYSDKLTAVHDDFKNIEDILQRYSVKGLDGAVLDLGISSRQIDDAERGFSYMKDAALDMRMDRSRYLTAENVVNEYAEDRLAAVIKAYGEEDFAKKIAAAIVKERERQPIKTTGQLAAVIKSAVPARFQYGSHPAKKTFQAVRIEVNGELDSLDDAVKTIADKLNKGARLCVLTFHSLEDRIVKQAFRLLGTDCICNKALPVCVCGHKASAKVLGKPMPPSGKELEENSRSASAKLRVIEKL